MSYGLTSAGFVVKDLQTIKTEMEEDFKAAFGNDVDLEPTAVAGQLVGNWAVKLASMWELLQAIYSSFHPDSAEDVALDGIVALNGISRIAATSTEVWEILYGAEGTVVPADHLIAQENATQFYLREETEITADVAADVIVALVNDPVEDDVHTVTINLEEFEYTALEGDSKTDVVTALLALIEAGGQPVAGEIIDDTLRIYATDGFTPFAAVLSATLEFDMIGTPALYWAEVAGATSAPVGSVNTIVQPVTGLDHVSNLLEGETGRETETDDELRVRRRQSYFLSGFATQDAITARVLQEVSGVTFARVISNRTDSTDGDGRPPHSFEAIVMGGTDEDVAQKLWEVAPAGINFYGSTEVTVQDSTGFDQVVKFSRPTPKYIWVEIEVTQSLEEDFPVNGASVIKDAIVAWAAAHSSVGLDVVWQKLFSPLYTCPGIYDAVLEIGVSDDALTPPVSYSAANIVIGSTELALFDVARISVAVS